MTNYDKMLIDLLNDKIRQWEHRCNEQRKEINRQKAEIRELKKEIAAREDEEISAFLEKKRGCVNE